MSNKLIKDLDDEKWRRFVALCKVEGVRVSEKIEEILDDYVDKRMRRMFK